MLPEPVEASIDLPLHLYSPYNIVVAVLFRIQLRRMGRQPFDTDLPFRRQILFYIARDGSEIGPKSLSTAVQGRVACGATFSPPAAREATRGNDAYKSATS